MVASSAAIDKLSDALAYYWAHPFTDQRESLDRLRAAVAGGDEAQIVAAVASIRKLLSHYWKLPNSDQSAVLDEVDRFLSNATRSSQQHGL